MDDAVKRLLTRMAHAAFEFRAVREELERECEERRVDTKQKLSSETVFEYARAISKFEGFCLCLEITQRMVGVKPKTPDRSAN